MSVRHEKDKGVNVQVLLRCRPFSEEELRSNAPQVVTCNDFQREVTVCQSIANKQIDRTFTFDKVFGPSAQQKDLYDQAVIPIVNEVLEGFNCTIFAYGQTGTGKTYTMEGESKKGKNAQTGELPTDAGVIPRAVKQIFDTLESQNAEYSVKVTFLELYNEEITDLLAPDDLSKAVLDDKQKKPLALMEDGKGGVLIRGLEEEIVTSANEIFTLLERGSAKRRTAETLLNKQSSRSHSLFSITIHIKEATPEGEELIKCGKLNLVDLAGSENISRSGARDGRAREAGEINKSLLTLGRVITALVEHLGHIPYRDSKLTRLLRDSLGGRTKTCIIATVSPSVHCLEETLSTLDYAHRAKNIKNKPEVNQKMMKSTLIKDLYGEIERLKLEVYAAREKSGVYIPKDRYYQEEAEKKAMADRIEQLEVTLETNNKRFEDLQEKYYAKQRHCNELTSNLDFTQRSLDNTKKSLASLNDNYKKAQFEIKERDYVIATQKDSETALTNQACLLRADLEQSIQDVAGLFAKIERKEKVCNGNKQLVESFQSELAERIGVLCNTVIQSMSKQNQHLQSVEKQFSYCMDFKDKSSEDLKNKVNNLKMQYVSHLQGLQNIVRLHKASSDAVLDEVKSAASNNTIVLEQLFEQAVSEGDAVLKELQNSLLDQQSEIAEYAHQMRERARTGIEVATTISDATTKFFGELAEQTSKLQGLINHYHTDDEKSLIDFQREYEEQSKQEEEKLISEITSLVAKAMVRKSELVNTRISNLKDSALQKRESLQSDVSTIETVTSDAKRKWETFAKQAEEDANDNAAISAAKHCRMEVILHQCMSTTTNASQQWKSTKKTVEDIGKNHQQTMESLARDGEDANEKHIAEIEQARLSAETAVDKHSEDILLHVQSSLENEHKVASEIQSTIAAQLDTLNTFQKDHKDRVVEIEEHTEQCFRDDYVEDHPTSTTPTKKKFDIPTKDSIESLRAPGFDILVEEFRENNPQDSEVKELQENGVVKDTKPYQDSFNLRDSRTPLIQLNCDYYVDDININQH